MNGGRTELDAYWTKWLRHSMKMGVDLLELLERLRKDRVEKIVAEGRRRGGGKEEVSAFQSRLRNTMMKFFLGRANEKSNDWLFSYKLSWNERIL